MHLKASGPTRLDLEHFKKLIFCKIGRILEKSLCNRILFVFDSYMFARFKNFRHPSRPERPGARDSLLCGCARCPGVGTDVCPCDVFCHMLELFVSCFGTRASLISVLADVRLNSVCQKISWLPSSTKFSQFACSFVLIRFGFTEAWVHSLFDSVVPSRSTTLLATYVPTLPVAWLAVLLA